MKHVDGCALDPDHTGICDRNDPWETVEARCERLRQEHEATYQALAEKLGIEALERLLPTLRPGTTWTGLLAADPYLNNVPLARWDTAAGCSAGPLAYHDSHWPQSALRNTRHVEPWCRVPTLSLSERVCVLKHVAKIVAGRELD